MPNFAIVNKTIITTGNNLTLEKVIGIIAATQYTNLNAIGGSPTPNNGVSKHNKTM